MGSLDYKPWNLFRDDTLRTRLVINAKDFVKYVETESNFKGDYYLTETNLVLIVKIASNCKSGTSLGVTYIVSPERSFDFSMGVTYFFNVADTLIKCLEKNIQDISTCPYLVKMYLTEGGV